MLTCTPLRLVTAPLQDLQLRRKTQISRYQRPWRDYCRMQVQYETMGVTSSTEWKTYATLRLTMLNICLQVALDSSETHGMWECLFILLALFLMSDLVTATQYYNASTTPFPSENK